MKSKRFWLMLPFLLAPSMGCHETVYMDFSLIYYAGEGGTIVEPWNDIQVVYKDHDGIEVTASPNPGYVFVEWSDGITNATRQDKNIQANLVVTAFFEREAA